MLSKIGSICGKPQYCDKCTISRIKFGYARILVEMDSLGDFHEIIELIDEHGVGFQEKVVYEWKPSICTICKRFGHHKQYCREGTLEVGVEKIKPGHDLEKQIVKKALEMKSRNTDSTVVHKTMGEMWKEVVKGKAVYFKENVTDFNG